ncbi:hypothetical protein [Phyllobacterium bourgognense]|uniref:Uncharacterized protein n=1 Tax=Phyllobacterium bourgognense TaxID=314236 RepID=A0A368YGS5_9HYPH|nr:hypothetical protein [Phyllobacterium bourgognense]RCW78516.1 hypothetical protein C7476_12447 [Phyllobacterium bourgognense]
MPIQGPPSCEEYADRAIDCQKALEPRFNELLNKQVEVLDVLDEATAAGWSREEAVLALDELFAARTKVDDELEEAMEQANKRTNN